MRARRYRHLATSSASAVGGPGGSGNEQVGSDVSGGTTGTHSGNSHNGVGLSSAVASASGASSFSHVASDLLDAADKRVPTLGLNGRRKFFHALTVAMFVPGIALDPAFTHLSFSIAFAVFVFAEYIRYFAIYPFGAVVHLFLNEFLDHKDGGTAILSHFYLLTGCAGPLWLQGPWRALDFAGVFTLGVGDALASIVGKRWGRLKWAPTTSKTVEGSAAFALSVLLCAWALRGLGVISPFSTSRYGFVTVLTAILEALSLQNDNLTMPLFMWCMSVLCHASETR